MRRNPFRVAARALVAVVAIILGCGSQKQFEHIAEHSGCEVLDPNTCRGFYGFAIDNHGNFTAGPSLTGKTVQGKITPDELTALTLSASSFLSSPNNVLQCQAMVGIPGITDQLSLFDVAGGETTVYALNSPSGECFSGDQSKAISLRDGLHQLLAKYYPVPFPT